MTAGAQGELTLMVMVFPPTFTVVVALPVVVLVSVW